MKHVVLILIAVIFLLGANSGQVQEQKSAANSESAKGDKDLPVPPKWPGLSKAPSVETVLTSKNDSAPFGTAEHAAMARSILKKDKNAQLCSEELAKAQWEQDIMLQVWAPAHFDNCTFDKSLNYIKEKLEEVDRLIGLKNTLPKDDALNAMYLLGQALHGVQDFYAHTDYLELQQKLNPTNFSKVKSIDVWRNDDSMKGVHALVNEGLVSGRVWWDFPHECPDSVKTHGEMAKEAGVADSNKPIAGWGNRTLYTAALDLARQSSERYILDAFSRWKVLSSACGNAISFILMVDNRKAPE